MLRFFQALILLAWSATLYSQETRAQRIISLAPHLTEAVFWLGAGERLKGRDRYSDYPAEAATVPVVGDTYNLNIEALLAAKPDLVLLWQAPQHLVKQLQKYGLQVYNSNPRSLGQIYKELEQLAALMAVNANVQLAALSTEIDALLARSKPKKPLKALLLVQNQPPIALGNGDTLAASLPACGWQNVFKQSQPVINVNPEYLPTGDYQAVISFTREQNPYLKAVPVFTPVADPLVRPGPRFVSALAGLCDLLDSAQANLKK